ARRAAQTFDQQVRAVEPGLARRELRGNIRALVGAPNILFERILVGACGRRGAIAVVVLQTRTRDQLRDRKTARAAHGLFATVDMCFERRAVQRLGAVEAVVYSCARWNAGR